LYKNVLLSDEELEKLKTEFSDWEERIERLSEYIESSGKRYKSHLATIRAWARKDTKEEKKTNKQAFRGSQDMSDVYGDELIL
jgi:Asp-tRNA(Asn)/Glu-tRNA(Gln) amidotransferase C subunit